MSDTPTFEPKFAPIPIQSHEAEMRLDRWVQTQCPQLGFGQVQKLLRSGQVRVDGKRAKGEHRLQIGQAVRLPPFALNPHAPQGEAPERPKPAGMSAEAAWELLAPWVVYDDEDLFIINKPAKFAVQGGSGIGLNIDKLLEAMAVEGGDRPRLVHRLDQDTSGCLIVARSRPITVKMTELFRNRSVAKTYWAVVEGIPKPTQGRITLPLKPYNAGNGEKKMMVTTAQDKDGQRAETVYSVVDKAHKRVAWVSLKPVTGRTHQLRVHMAAIETPIIGDRKYGEEFHGEDWAQLHLHARRVQFPHPRTGKTVDATAPLPEHMVQTFDAYGFQEKG